MTSRIKVINDLCGVDLSAASSARRSFVLLIPAMCAAGAPAFAQEAATRSGTYGALSLIGDHLSIVSYEPQVGSALDTNRRQEILDVPDAVLDQAALVTVKQFIEKVSSHPPVFYQSSSPDMFAEQGRWFNGSKAVLPDAFRVGFVRDQVTYLVLLTKYRGEARLKARATHLGSGKLEGLGFYIDRTKWMTRSDTNERSLGFLAPFVYVKVSLIEAASGEVLRSELITETTTLSAARNRDGVDPWGVLTAAEKVKILRDMLDGGLQRVLPLLLKA